MEQPISKNKGGIKGNSLAGMGGEGYRRKVKAEGVKSWGKGEKTEMTLATICFGRFRRLDNTKLERHKNNQHGTGG